MQDGPALNEISSKRGFRLSSTFKRIHNRLDASRSGSRSADENRPRSGNVPAVLGLVALTAVTSWVVARISVWLVPVYMSAMVLIFAAPRTNRPKAAARVPEELATEPNEGAEPTSDDDSRGTPSVPVEPPTAVDAAAASPKPRKRRGKGKRSTKAAAAATEADPTAAQVTWIRVGPGKFVRADAQDPETEGSPSPVSVPDADAETVASADEPDEGIHDDSLTVEDETTRAEAAPEEPGSFELPEPPEVSEARAEEHGIAPSTLGEGPETIVFSDEADHEDSQPDFVASLAAEPIAEAEPVAAPLAPIASIPIPSTTAIRDLGPTRPPVLLDPPTAEAHRRRTVGPVVCSSPLRNVRRGDAPRPSTFNGRGVDVRLRQRSSRIRSRLIRVERDFQPRSPPTRA